MESDEIESGWLIVSLSAIKRCNYENVYLNISMSQLDRTRFAESSRLDTKSFRIFSNINWGLILTLCRKKKVSFSFCFKLKENLNYLKLFADSTQTMCSKINVFFWQWNKNSRTLRYHETRIKFCKAQFFK